MIIFLFSHIGSGGMPVLFRNIAEYFSEINVPLCLISKEKSGIHSMFVQSHFDFLFIDYNTLSDDIISNKITEKDVVILHEWIPKLPLFKGVNPKILFWNTVPNIIYNSNQIRGKIYLHTPNRILLKTMLEKKGLYFMDDAPFEWMKKYKIYSFPNEFLLQIPVQPINYLYQRKDVISTELRISYIGRAVIWKLFPLVKIIEDLDRLKYNFKLNIITDSIKETKEFIRLNTQRTNNNIELIYFENIPNNHLYKHLLENSDLNIGMGTACLEGAKVGIPSLLIDASYIRMGDNFKYTWLYETGNYRLGKYYKNTSLYKGHDLIDIVENCYKVKNYLKIKSQACFTYIKENHHLNVVGEKTKLGIENTTLHVKDVTDKVFFYSAVYRYTSYIKSLIKSLIKYQKRNKWRS